MKTEKWMPLATFAALLVSTASCDDWGKQDPPAGNQIKPTLQNVATYDFEAEEGLDPSVYRLIANPDGNVPQVVDDEEKGKVLEINNGFMTVSNPLTSVVLQNAASLTFWLKIDPASDAANMSAPLISFQNETGNGGLSVTADGGIRYSAADGEWSAAGELAEFVTPGEWHFMAVALKDTGYEWSVDGEKKIDKEVTDFDCTKFVAVANSMPDLTVGAANNSALFYIDDLNVFRNTITEKESARPELTGGGGGGTDSPLVYFNSFDAGLGGCKIEGGGEIKYVGGAFGNVFSNAMNGMRQNYLLLPEDALSHSAETKTMTISVWVNRGNETESAHYNWSPLFTAYAAAPNPENTFPMLACQYRGVLQVNNNGWSDYTDAQNVNGKNAVYHNDTGADWLADGKWHLYTATFTEKTAKVYFDGVIANEWNLEGTDNTAAGLFSNGADLKYICLGGNQAWNWGDPDPGFWFDDIAIYNQELSQEQIVSIFNLKNSAIYGNTFSNDAGDANKKGAGEFIENATPGFGKIFKNAVGGMRENYLLLPENALSGVGETEEMTISVWLNSTDAGDYFWNPVFTAYAEAPGGDGCPMLACQYRGVVSVNTNGPDNQGDSWCDYGADLSDTGEVILYHGELDWLADKNWHLYTVVFTPTRAIVYLDGEVGNSWTLDGVSRGQICDLKAVATMKCICLGGNQAWNWADPDPGFGFDDIFIYNKALTQDEVKQLMLQKK